MADDVAGSCGRLVIRKIVSAMSLRKCLCVKFEVLWFGNVAWAHEGCELKKTSSNA